MLVGDGTGTRDPGKAIMAPLRLLHGTVWLFLAAAFLLAGILDRWQVASACLAALGGSAYIVYVVLLLRTGRP
ncbi:MAG TPA: hypothetical protein VFP72_24450 [Kineosporiaceae bacterium]|nr:hypothetical protein [Kineosporiaceae bacterium]